MPILESFPHNLALAAGFALLGAGAMVLACERGGPEVDAGSNLACDALPGVCSEDGGSAAYPFAPSVCPNLAQVAALACPDSTTIYAICGSGGAYDRIGCTKPGCSKDVCDGGLSDAER